MDSRIVMIIALLIYCFYGIRKIINCKNTDNIKDFRRGNKYLKHKSKYKRLCGIIQIIQSVMLMILVLASYTPNNIFIMIMVLTILIIIPIVIYIYYQVYKCFEITYEQDTR